MALPVGVWSHTSGQKAAARLSILSWYQAPLASASGLCTANNPASSQANESLAGIILENLPGRKPAPVGLAKQNEHGYQLDHRYKSLCGTAATASDPAVTSGCTAVWQPDP